MPVRVAELFAGVGGFRLGLEASSPLFETVWWNQWEPATKTVQHAWDIYRKEFCEARRQTAPAESNSDICQVPTDRVRRHDLLVAGFPCQDYSVATSLSRAGGLQGKKGVLWWEIHRILEEMGAKRRPAYLLLENVDRLLRSPAEQRGRDFGIVLGCLRDLGYRVEWRIVNAANYGCMTRRRRVFIFAAHKRTGIGRHMARSAAGSTYLYHEGFFAKCFRTSRQSILVDMVPPSDTLPSDVRKVSKSYTADFDNAGVMVDGKLWMRPVTEHREGDVPLREALEFGPMPPWIFLDQKRLESWQKVKGSKRIERVTSGGFRYRFSEGRMQFPDQIEKPARTILTSEANRSANRSTHVISDPATGRLRFLTPLEVEKVMGFPPHWTAGVPDRWRYFTMGNALVVPLVTRMGNQLMAWIEAHEPGTRQGRLLEKRKSAAAKPVVAR